MAAQAPPRFVLRQRRSGRLRARDPQRPDSRAGAAASPPRDDAPAPRRFRPAEPAARSLRRRPPCLQGRASAPCSAWWSSSSWRPAWRGSRSLRQPLSFSSIACRMPARMPCSLAFQLEAIPSGSPGPVLYCEDREEVRWGSTW